MHGPGVDGFIRDICKRLAAEGYVAIAPNLYHRQGKNPSEPWTKVDDLESIADMRTAVDFLESQQVEPIGAVGFCMGGRLVYLQLAHEPRLRTGVIFHGGNIAVARGDLPSPLDQTDAIRASVLAIFGNDDTNPSPLDRQRIEARLKEHGVAYRLESYDGAGHAFLNFTRPEMYREQQAASAWNLCTSWLSQRMAIGA